MYSTIIDVSATLTIAELFGAESVHINVIRPNFRMGTLTVQVTTDSEEAFNAWFSVLGFEPEDTEPDPRIMASNREMAIVGIKYAIAKAENERAEMPSEQDENDDDMGRELDAIIALARGYMVDAHRDVFDAMTPTERMAYAVGWA